MLHFKPQLNIFNQKCLNLKLFYRRLSPQETKTAKIERRAQAQCKERLGLKMEDGL